MRSKVGFVGLLIDEAEDAAFKKGWTPRRRGVIYCSPLCGANCTHLEFMTATRRAAALAKRLGPGWEPRVWENMGWFYSVSKGVTTVHANHQRNRINTSENGRQSIRQVDKATYSVFFNSAHQIVTCEVKPEEALQVAISKARQMIRQLCRDVREIS